MDQNKIRLWFVDEPAQALAMRLPTEQGLEVVEMAGNVRKGGRVPVAQNKVRLLFVDEPAKAFVAHLFAEHGYEVVDERMDEDGNRAPVVMEENFVTLAERRSLQAVADQGSRKAAARACGVATCTIKTHVENLRQKFGVHTGVQLVAEGFRLGLLR